MLRVLTTSDADFSTWFPRLINRGQDVESPVESQVRAILRQVQHDGDDALLELTAHSDHVSLSPETLRVSSAEIDAAHAQCSEHTLRALGRRAHEAHRLTRSFQRHDERAIANLASLWGKDQKQFFAAAREALQETERLLREESGRKFGSDHAWDTDTLRGDASSRG